MCSRRLSGERVGVLLARLDRHGVWMLPTQVDRQEVEGAARRGGADLGG